jgi:flagellar biosynthesis chaperone FliJ
MEIIPIKLPLHMTLLDNDKRLIHIEEVIEAKRRMLLHKQKKIKFVLKQNRFLDTVKNDYVKYYRYIIEQKQDQIKSLELLNRYIFDLSSSNILSKNNIEDAKVEQDRILHEIKSIKKGLDSIINNTNHINSELNKNNISM